MALVLWAQGGVDRWALFVFDQARVSGASWLGIFARVPSHRPPSLAQEWIIVLACLGVVFLFL